MFANWLENVYEPPWEAIIGKANEVAGSLCRDGALTTGLVTAHEGEWNREEGQRNGQSLS